MFTRRTFIVRLSDPDRSVLLENSLTRERVQLSTLSQVAGQIERWLAEAHPHPPAVRGDVHEGR